MKIALAGHGKVGKEIESVALDRGIDITGIYVDSDGLNNARHQDSVCIDFTSPGAFKRNFKHIADNFGAAVVGTTGWDDMKEEISEYFNSKKKTMIYASNFCTGVNVFYKIAEVASKLSAKFGNYDLYLIDMHHTQKKDAPSGTAKTIEKIVWDASGKDVKSVSVRSGFIKGIHELGFESDNDKISLRHEVYTRRGFAEGALLAAEMTKGVKGVHNFSELIEKEFANVINNK